ncbi:acyl-CoA desaturase [Rapidithrix thailandica]|uniref:Acyl-CoA desaturase n=1 Tax=Rapidithrix thailandica TaxID=413964 RepID=A0AAW9RS45_9BACT
MELVAFFVIHWYASLFFQSVFHHRYAAHGLFTMSRTMEKLFYLGCFFTQGSSYMSASAYGIMHRLHHAHTDTESDPHSPKNTPSILGMLWSTRNNYFNIYSGKTEVDEKFKKNLPDWKSFEKITHNWIVRVMWIGIYTSIYIHFATAWWMFLFLPITCAMASLQGAAVNWWAHKFGYVNFRVNNTSKNILPIDLIFWGEAYHNNHHRYPNNPNNSAKWFEIDPGYYMMKLLDKLGIIRLKTLAPTV